MKKDRTFIRVNKNLLKQLSNLKEVNPNPNKNEQAYESYSNVLKRLLIKHHKSMEKEKEEA